MITRLLGLFVGAAGMLALPRSLESQVRAGRSPVLDEATANGLATRLGITRQYEITKEMLEDFRTGLTTELRLLEAFRKELAAYPPAEQYRACEQQLSASGEMMELLMRPGAIPNGATPEQMNRIVEKLGLEVKALLKRKCGASIEADWSPSNRGQRRYEIHEAGEKAFEAARAARAARPRGPDAGHDEPASMELGPLSGGPLYATLKDELGAFCELWHAKLIIQNAPGQFVFSFNAPLPLSSLYSQPQAAEMTMFCDSFTDTDLGLLLMYGIKP